MSSHPEHDIHANCETNHPQETGRISMQEISRTDHHNCLVGRCYRKDRPGAPGGVKIIIRWYDPDDNDETDEWPERPIPNGYYYINLVPTIPDGGPIEYEMVRINLSPLTREDSKEQEPIPRPSLSPTPLVADSARCRHWTLMLLFFLFGTIASGIYYRWRHQVAMEALKVHLTLGAREEAGV
ncbi:hypothetical protein B0J18DRAFT_209676 [Chaetomium sp. MPI-SDFR-AT-0129]|nr:hypothetical protein B0J18DRAFT_209676 [Chaetomium sp. MPI-SDFR-AT-0129]